MSIFGKIVGKLDEEKNKIQKIINEPINEPTNSTSELFDSKENNIHDPISNKQNQIVKEEQTVSVTVNANQSPPTYQPMSSNMASQTESVQQTQPRQSTTPQMHQSAAINISSQTNPGQANTAAQAKSVQMPQPTQQFASNPTLSKRVENQDVSLPPVVNIGNINDGKFSDVYITPDKKTYIWGGKTNDAPVQGGEEYPPGLKRRKIIDMHIPRRRRSAGGFLRSHSVAGETNWGWAQLAGAELHSCDRIFDLHGVNLAQRTGGAYGNLSGSGDGTEFSGGSSAASGDKSALRLPAGTAQGCGGCRTGGCVCRLGDGLRFWLSG